MAEMSRNEEKRRQMQKKMQEMAASGKGGKGKPKAKNFAGTLKRLITYKKGMKPKIILVVVCAVIATGCTVLAPYVLAMVLDIIQGKVAKGTDLNWVGITRTLIVLGFLYVLNTVLSITQGRTVTTVTQETLGQLRQDVNKKIMKLPFSYFDSNSTGDILSRLTNDIDNIGNAFQQTAVQFIQNIVTIVGCIIFMFLLSWKLTLLCLITLPFTIIGGRMIMAKSQVYFREQWNVLGELNGLAEETFSGLNVIRAFGYEKNKTEEYFKKSDELYAASRKAQFLSGIINPVSSIFNNIAYILICCVGAFFAINGMVSIGSITAMIQYQKQYSNPVTQIATVLNTLQSAVASAERVFEVLDEKEEEETSDNYRTLDKVEGNIKFEHLKFGYTADKLLMTDINVDVKKGQMIAIVGPTGAGKTTLVNLLMRFYEPNGGQISIDGMNIRDMTRHDLRDIFGMVLQETWLFSGTIHDNIGYGKSGATEEQIRAAAKAAQVEFFFDTMPDGYDTMLNEEASNISQGQKQLLTIARAMLADPPILILDEATSSVDTRTEVMIQQAMNNLLKGRTSFVIAHRLSTIKDADLILYMENGNIVEQGNHVSLMEQGGKYAELYNSQFAQS
ncbi:MAG: ABC transporter ATP-binding protein/permease [Lachnospiraceae bacterium]|nr:ABC transporter ATP-binding protein/permease [Lachnospiraceae bacterium]